LADGFGGNCCLSAQSQKSILNDAILPLCGRLHRSGGDGLQLHSICLRKKYHLFSFVLKQSWQKSKKIN
jgi:hypothetical protein